MRTLIVSSSMNTSSRSNHLARMAADWLTRHNTEVSHIQLQPNHIPGFDNDDLFESSIYLDYYQQTQAADNLIFSSPVYNWSICSDLKKFIEVIGSTDDTRKSPFFDKLVSCIFAAGLPHSYMVLGNIALPMMMDFRCVINPHQAYLHNRHWDGPLSVTQDGRDKLEQMLTIHLDLAGRLYNFRPTDRWQV